MNNFKFLNVINPQISYAINSGIEKCNKKFMVCIPGVVGYDNNVACSLFLMINEKLISKSQNDGLERLFKLIMDDPSILLTGLEDFVLGEDYFLSESLYDWLCYTCIDPDTIDTNLINRTTVSFLNTKVGTLYKEKITITNISSEPITPVINCPDLHDYIYIDDVETIEPGHGYDLIVNYRPMSDGVHNSTFDIIINNEKTTINVIANAIEEDWEFNWPKGITILHGVDVNMLLNLNRLNKYVVGEILTEEYLEQLRDEYYKCWCIERPIMTKPEIIEDSSSDESEEEQITFVMNDYIVFNPDLTWKQDTNNYKWLFDINIKDMRNLDWFYLKNRYISSEAFTDDEICNIPNTFFKIIYEYGIIQNSETIKNQIYDLVSKYFMNGQTDIMYRGLNLLLSSAVSNQNNNKLNCGCASDGLYNNNLNGDSLTSCADLYKTSMMEWLKNMFSDPEYYKDWFFTINTAMCPSPNEPMIDLLIRLLEDFLANNYDSFIKINGNKMYLNDHYCCDNADIDNGVRTAIENYIKLLKVVKNNEIDGNINKIKVWGSAFAEVFPYLTC